MRIEIDRKSTLMYLAMLFILLLFFYKIGPWKLILVYHALLFIVQLPGTFLLSIATGVINMPNLLFGLCIGLVDLGLSAYLFGLFRINYKYSLLLSVGVPYIIFIARLGRQVRIKK
jgi:hypothetical protein